MTITRLGERLYMVEDTPMISPTDIETRAAIEFYVAECANLTHEVVMGYGLKKKSSIVTQLRRALTLAETLDGD